VDQCGQAADHPSRVFRCRRPRETSSPTSRAIPRRVRLASRSSTPLGVAALAFAAPSSSFLRPRGLRPTGLSALASSEPSLALPLPHGRLPQVWAPLRASSASPTRACHPGFPSWGSWPLQRRGLAGPHHPGVQQPRLVPPPRFHTSLAVCSLHALRPRGRCHSWGSTLKGPFVRSPRRVAAAHASPCRRGSCIPNSEEYEVRNFATPIR